METLRKHGKAPYRIAVLHGGPGGAGEVAPVARRLGQRRGVLEPLQTGRSVSAQVSELERQLRAAGDLPVVLVGWSWGAWLAWMLAARSTSLVSKLILVGSGPFEESYLDQVAARRDARTSAEEQAEQATLFRDLGGLTGDAREVALRRLARLMDRGNGHSIMDEAPTPIDVDPVIFARVWPEAAEMRRSGALLGLASRIRCPVVAIHGDDDPHPPEGVRQPLERVLPSLRFIGLERCGHKPWIERYARDAFYEALEAELVI